MVGGCLLLLDGLESVGLSSLCVFSIFSGSAFTTQPVVFIW